MATRASNAPSRSSSALGKAPSGRSEDRLLHHADGVDAVERHGGAGGGHAEFERIEPGGVRAALLQQRVALAHGFLVGGAEGAVAGEVGHHLPVEEAAAIACGAGEDAVHRGGEPDDAHQLAEVVLRGGGAIEAGDAFGPALLVDLEGELEAAIEAAFVDVGR